MDASIPLDDIKLLLKISNNIITQPNIQKYQNIRLTSLHTKLKNYDGCILVLCDMGFRSSFDEKRLIFDCTQSNIKKMKWFNMVWTRKLNSATTTSITNEFCRPFEPTKSQDEIDSDYFHKKKKMKWFNMVWTRKLNSATTTSITNEFCRPFEPTKSQDEIDS
eukprot:523868_1